MYVWVQILWVQGGQEGGTVAVQRSSLRVVDAVVSGNYVLNKLVLLLHVLAAMYLDTLYATIAESLLTCTCVTLYIAPKPRLSWQLCAHSCTLQRMSLQYSSWTCHTCIEVLTGWFTMHVLAACLKVLITHELLFR